MNSPASKIFTSYRLSYLITALFAVMQGVIIGLYADRSMFVILDAEEAFFYLPLILAIFLPTALSYLIITLKSKHLYYSLAVTLILILWIYCWKNFNIAPESFINEPEIVITIFTLIILLFFLLPWLQFYTQYGAFSAPYDILIKCYIRNILFGVMACGISGLLLLLIIFAGFLFDLIGFSALKNIVQLPLSLWIIFLLGMNVTLLFLRLNFEIEINRVCSYIARFFLPLLNLITLIFLIGLCLSSGIEIDSIIMLSLCAASIILINLVYEDGSSEYQFPKWLNYFVLLNILLLNAFTLLTLYGISVRVLQYSWSIGRLYAFTLAIFFMLLVLSYSVAIIRKKTRWMQYIGKINSCFLLLIIGIILTINSPLLNFSKISANSILNGIEQGNIPINSTLRSTLQDLGKQGIIALKSIEKDPRFEMARRAENNNNTDIETKNEVPTPNPQESYLQIDNHTEIPLSWWETQYNNYYCTEAIDDYKCLAFTADMNQDTNDEVLNCLMRKGDYPWIRCTTWQEKSDNWQEIETLSFHFKTKAERDKSWEKLLSGQFEMRPKTWLDLYIIP